jgi:hypothetical protein
MVTFFNHSRPGSFMLCVLFSDLPLHFVVLAPQRFKSFGEFPTVCSDSCVSFESSAVPARLGIEGIWSIPMLAGELRRTFPDRLI